MPAFSSKSSPPSSASPAGGPGETEHRFTVLLGNDPAEMEAWQANACGLLQSQGVGTLLARTGREALGLIEQSARGSGPRIHVAVLDQRLPVMGGLQILRRLQQDLEELRATRSGAVGRSEAPASVSGLPPTILLADRGGRELHSGLMHDALMAQVFSVLPKPIELDLLLDTLARALKRYYAGRWPCGGRNPET